MDDAFTVRAGLERGLTRGVMRGAQYLAPVHGTRIPAALGDLDRAAVEAALREVARDDQFFSHTTAARLHGIPLPMRLRDAPIHLASPTLGHRMRRAGIVGHRIRAEVVEVDGVRVECALDTLVHLATMLTVLELVVALDWVLQPRNGHAITKLDVLARLEHFRGARGIGGLRTALVLARSGSESPKETELRLLIARHAFPEPALNVDVRDAHGRFIARLDLAWPELRIALEYDGEHHLTDAWQFSRDIDRVADLERAGWIVVRVTKAHLASPDARLLPRVRDAFARRGVEIAPA